MAVLQRDDGLPGASRAEAAHLHLTLQIQPRPPEPAIVVTPQSPRRIGGWVSFAVVFALCLGAGWLWTSRNGGERRALGTQASVTAPDTESGAAFLDQLRAPPTVIPPPGSPAQGSRPGGPALFGFK
jgi:hypothetical protein